VSLCRFHHRAVHEEGFNVQVLDDGAFRFVNARGESVDRVQPGCMQPSGDFTRMPKGQFTECWRGDRMDLHLAVAVMIQESRKTQDVPAGTSRLVSPASTR
jgi:hypothetical protein